MLCDGTNHEVSELLQRRDLVCLYRCAVCICNRPVGSFLRGPIDTPRSLGAQVQRCIETGSSLFAIRLLRNLSVPGGVVAKRERATGRGWRAVSRASEIADAVALAWPDRYLQPVPRA